MRFEIGKDVACIKDNSGKATLSGKIYPLLNISKRCCYMILDLGITTTNSKCRCNCGKVYTSGGVWWQSSFRFVPLDDWKAAEEAKEELLEELKVKI